MNPNEFYLIKEKFEIENRSFIPNIVLRTKEKYMSLMMD